MPDHFPEVNYDPNRPSCKEWTNLQRAGGSCYYQIKLLQNAKKIMYIGAQDDERGC